MEVSSSFCQETHKVITRARKKKVVSQCQVFENSVLEYFNFMTEFDI